MLKRTLFSLFVFTLISPSLFSQTYNGPAAGSKTGGVVVNTNSFGLTPSNSFPRPETIRNKADHKADPVYIQEYDEMYDAIKLYVEDRNAGKESVDTTKAILLKDFQGLTQTNSIPPDPHVAVGAGYIVAVVNSDFGIYDMAGNLIKRINADQWYASTMSNPGAFDPKVIYDHFDKRWVMVWLDQNDNPARGNLLFSVSDDSIPTGTWYNFVFRSDVNGDVPSGNWMDYQGVGFDDDAIYVSGNQFSFASSFNYAKIRIFPKAPLYSNDANATITWNDIYGIKYPAPAPTQQFIFHIRPTIAYTHDPSKYYFLHAPGSANFFALYWIENPLTAPVLRGSVVPVTSYSAPPDANQLGGGTPLISTNGGQLQDEPIFKDGSIWSIHSIRNPVASNYSALHYVKINTATGTASEQSILGANGNWYYFGAIAVDKFNNAATTFARSGDNEYAGAFYSSKFANETAFTYSSPLQTGKGNYVKTFGGTRNRWGDYMGIWANPQNLTDFVIFTEYAAGVNTWGTWTGILRVAPYDGVKGTLDKEVLNFGEVEVNVPSHVDNFRLTSFGTQNLVIDSLYFGTGNFELNTSFTYPFTLEPNTTVDIQLAARAVDLGQISDTLYVASNDGTLRGIALTAFGYEIIPSNEKAMFAVSGGSDNNRLFYLRTGNGLPTEIGPTAKNLFQSIAIHPKTKVLYGLRNSAPQEIVRINSNGGDAHRLFSSSVADLGSLAFDTTGNLYVSQKSGKIYKIGLLDSSFTETVQAQAAILSIAFHPQTNELYASLYRALGSPKDMIFRVNPSTGDTTRVGFTSFGVAITDLEFDADGVLFGFKGATNQPVDLIKINSTTGLGELIASTGVVNLAAMTFNHTGTATDVKTPVNVPANFALNQNYPNPFNPTTRIEYSLPKAANVKITVYNLLGEVVKVLYNDFNTAGSYSIYWNADDITGAKLTSGVYFYELKANSVDGEIYSDIKKMVLLK
ncbi:MAG: T9SS type A sorting domain-containing protein [Ignavibacteriales bacterium]|nr:T9SS type A sorting domain-containing protein [Ignavibacteriales bacterium]MBP9122252.1 T9SS type A sorting domain-containing protein [Ignavibacteriaceae bacterium]